MMKKTKKQIYTAEFQGNAVNLVMHGSKSLPEVARQLAVPEWKLRLWVKAARVKEEKGEHVSDLIKLQNENKRLKEENEILKKAAAYFAQHLQ